MDRTVRNIYFKNFLKKADHFPKVLARVHETQMRTV